MTNTLRIEITRANGCCSQTPASGSWHLLAIGALALARAVLPQASTRISGSKHDAILATSLSANAAWCSTVMASRSRSARSKRWADPRKLAQSPERFAKLAKALGRDPEWLARRVTSNLDREFVYLVRHMRPQDAAKVKALGIPGVDTLREYRRYYPAGEVTGHLLGFTNVDDVGQEGLELAFDQWLGGQPGECDRRSRRQDDRRHRTHCCRDW
jgi:cell division protein FtsI/penicillin-binding protein 2